MSAFRLSLKGRLPGRVLDGNGQPDPETWRALASLAPGAVVAGALWACVALVATGLLIWQQDSGGLRAVSAPDLLVLLAPAGASYLLRLLRWHLLLRRAVGPVALVSGVRAQVIGFALATTPGRAAEPLKFSLLECSHRVTIARSGSVLLFERLSDALGLALVGLTALLFVAPDLLAADLLVRSLGLSLAAITLVVIAAACGSRLRDASTGRAARWGTMLADFLAANRALLSGTTAPSAAVLTALARMCDALTVYLAAGSLGLALSYPEAALVLGLAGLAGGVSLLPGGVGAVEAVMMGLLVGLGAAPAAALGITIVARVFTYWIWVAVGLATLGVSWRGLMTRGEKDARLSGLHPS